MPHRFRLASGGLTGFTGLWSVWTATEKTKFITCCIITTTANDVMRPYHDRMPAVLAPDDYATWLDADAPTTELHSLLKPYPSELMDVSEANPLMNNPKNDGPELLEPAA